MFTFSIARKIDEEKGINKNNFIIERIRRQRAINSNKPKNRIFIRNEKSPPS